MKIALAAAALVAPFVLVPMAQAEPCSMNLSPQQYQDCLVSPGGGSSTDSVGPCAWAQWTSDWPGCKAGYGPQTAQQRDARNAENACWADPLKEPHELNCPAKGSWKN